MQTAPTFPPIRYSEQAMTDRPEFTLAEALAIAEQNADAYKNVASVSRTLVFNLNIATCERDEAMQRADYAVRALRRTLLALGHADPGPDARDRWREASLNAIAGLVTDECIFASTGPLPIGGETGPALFDRLTRAVAPPPGEL